MNDDANPPPPDPRRPLAGRERRAARARPTAVVAGAPSGSEVWPWRWSLVGLAAVVPIGALGALTGPDTDVLLGVANALWLLFVMVVCGGGLALLAQYRLSGLVEVAWLAGVLLVGGVYLLVHVVPFPVTHRDEAGLAGADLIACAALLMIWAAARRTPPSGWKHPVLLAGVLSVGLLLVRRHSVPVPSVGPVLATSLGTLAVLGFCLLTVVWVRRMTVFPRSIRLAIGTTILVTTMLTRVPWWAVGPRYRLELAILLNGATTMLLITCLFAVLQWGISRYQRAVVGLADRANRAETSASHSEQVIEDLRSSLAGIARANELLRSPDGHLSDARRRALRASVGAEMHRLEQLLATSPEQEEHDVDLDGAVLAALEGHRTVGRLVRLTSSGLTVRGSTETVTATVRSLVCAVLERDPSARIHVVPERTATEVHVNLRVTSPVIAAYPHRSFGEAPSLSPTGREAEWDPLDLDHVSLLALRHRLRLRGEDVRWGQSPRGAEITVVLRR